MAKLLESSLHQQSTAHSFPSIFGSAPRLTERIDRARQTSQSGASTSGRDHCKACTAWLGTQAFDNSKLSVNFLTCVDERGPKLPAPRKYTLTHSDITGQLWLSVGQQYNRKQLSGWYLQLFRDEVLAEWLLDQHGQPQLHLFCHISSSQKWSGPIPLALRSRIFQREMPLVLKTLLYGDQSYLSSSPSLLGASVFLHLSSHIQALNIFMEWGILGDERSWRQPVASWFEAWWKSSVSVPYKADAPSQALLKEEAESKQGQPLASLPIPEKPALDTAFASAPANCGRAAAVLTRGSFREIAPKQTEQSEIDSVTKEIEIKIPQEASVSHSSRR